MIAGAPATRDSADRLLVIGNLSGAMDVVESLRRRFPAWDVDACPTYLSGIVDLAQRPARAVVACVDPGEANLESAIAGVRDVAGRRARLILCCTPELEPRSRRLLAFGADDYVLYPLDGEELDAAIGYPRMRFLRGAAGTPDAPVASMEELSELSSLLSCLSDPSRALVERFASLIRLAVGARGAMAVVEGAMATVGDPVTQPTLHAPLTGADGLIGQISVGPPQAEAYTPADAQKLSHYARVLSYVLQAAAQQREWRQRAVTDECSGLPNRRYLLEQLEATLARAAAEHFPVTLLLFDVDDFKTYNDAYGHPAGDEILRVTGELFRKHCRKQDIVARYGGDEFAVVFWDPQGPRVTGSKHPESALAVLDRVQNALRLQTFGCLGPSGTGRLTISGGLATFPWDANTSELLVKRADEALLAAKRAGKNRIFLIGQADAGFPAT